MANDWISAARKVQRKDSVELKSLPGGYIVRQKLSLDYQEQILELRKGFQLDEDGVPTDMPKGQFIKFHRTVILGGLVEFTFEDPDNSAAEKQNVILDDKDKFWEQLSEFPAVEDEIFTL